MEEKPVQRTHQQKMRSILHELGYWKDDFTNMLSPSELAKVLKHLNDAETQIRIASIRINREQESRENKKKTQKR